MNKQQVLLINGDRLIIKGAGFSFQKDTIVGKDEIEALTLEHYDSYEPESVWSLNLLLKRTQSNKRIMLAPFLHPKGKTELFYKIKDFLEGHAFNFETRNSYELRNTEQQF